MEYYKKAIEIDPTFAPSLYRLAKLVQERHGDLEQAEQLFRRAIDADGNNIMAYVQLGMLAETAKPLTA